jgi:hypothetical protein
VCGAGRRPDAGESRKTTEATMADQSLAMLAREVRNKTLRILENTGEEEWLWTPPGQSNHILWHAGHCLTVVEQLCLPEPRQVPGWKEIFFAGSKPATVKEWPSLGVVCTHLSGQLGKVVGYINSLSPDMLDQEIGTPERPRTRRYSILHGLHDEACHCGEIYLLKKMWAKR